ncbi:MAG: hypothetical protein ACLR8U_11830 [Oscillospiraceae bacterium]
MRIVTLDGQVMNPGGSMTGGSSAKSAGVLSRANELKRLEQEQKTLSDAQTARQKCLSDAQSQLAETEYELKNIGAELREAEDEVLRRTEEQKQVELLLETVSQAEQSVRQELERFSKRSGSDEGRLALLSQQLQEAETELMKLEAQQAQRQTELDQKTQAVSGCAAGAGESSRCDCGKERRENGRAADDFPDGDLTGGHAGRQRPEAGADRILPRENAAG